MSNFLELIQAASSSTDTIQREQYEAKLLQYIKQEPDNFLKESLINFGDLQVNFQVRQMIALILKKTLASESPRGLGTFYDCLDDD
jgi:importin subunit beta-1